MADALSQVPAFGITPSDLPDNADQRCPTLLLLDVSGSMAGQPIRELQDGVIKYIDELAAHNLARRRVEVSVVTFGGEPRIAHAFAPADQFVVPELTASGDTPMGKAINVGLDLLRQRKAELASHGIPQYRAWVFLITDGGPTDDKTEAWTQAVQQLREGEQRRSFLFFAVGVQGANMEKLNELCVDRKPLLLDGLRFRDLFQWLSASQKAVSSSKPGDQVQLPPVDWGKVAV